MKQRRRTGVLIRSIAASTVVAAPVLAHTRLPLPGPQVLSPSPAPKKAPAPSDASERMPCEPEDSAAKLSEPAAAMPATAMPATAMPAATPMVEAATEETPAAPEAPAAADTKPSSPGAPAAPAAAPTTPGTTTQPTPAGEALQVGGVTIYAERFEEDPMTGIFTATGHPRAVRGADEIRADRLLFHPATRQFTAEGNVIIVQNGQTIHASRATYSLEIQEGEVENVRDRFNQISVKADRMLLHAGPVYEALRARLTTCDDAHPHYDVFSRAVTIYPNDRIIAHGAAFDFLGHRLFTLPKLERSLVPTDPDDQSPYPTLGFNSSDGFYARKSFSVLRAAPVWLTGDAQISSAQPPSGGLLASTAGKLQLRGALFYHDIAENQISRFLRVSRLPQIGLVWTDGVRPEPGRFLPNQVAASGYPDILDVSRKWRFSASLDGGYFIQYRGEDISIPNARDRSGARIKAQVQGVLPTAKLGPITFNDLRLMVRDSVYDTGENFAVFGTGIGKSIPIGKFRLGIERIDQFNAGRTPFLFDATELREEWRPSLSYHSQKFNLTYTARIRGNNNSVYDQIITISKLFHCIEPQLSYHWRRGEVFLQIRIPGFTSFQRARPGQPATIDTGIEPTNP